MAAAKLTIFLVVELLPPPLSLLTAGEKKFCNDVKIKKIQRWTYRQSFVVRFVIVCGVSLRVMCNKCDNNASE